MRVFALDLSSHAGFAVLEPNQSSFNPEPARLIACGNILLDKTPEQFIGTNYPENFIHCAEYFATKIAKTIDKVNPDVVVVEETVPGQETYSQKLLEFFHFALNKELMNWNWKHWIPHRHQIKVFYVRTGEWRKVVEARMTKEERKGNLKKNLERAKMEAKEIRAKIKTLGTKKENKTKVEELKNRLSQLQLGKVSKKHVSIRISNKMFGLQLKVKDNDIADAILLGVAYMNGASICDGKRPSMKE